MCYFYIHSIHFYKGAARTGTGVIAGAVHDGDGTKQLVLNCFPTGSTTARESLSATEALMKYGKGIMEFVPGKPTFSGFSDFYQRMQPQPVLVRAGGDINEETYASVINAYRKCMLISAGIVAM